MYRLIPAIAVIILAFVVPAPASADPVEADAFFRTIDCIEDPEYMTSSKVAIGCHEDGLSELAFLSPDVTAPCAALWADIFAYHAISAAAIEYNPDLNKVDYFSVLSESVEPQAMACYGGQS